MSGDAGNNGYTAGVGYNLVTGLGSPVANRLVPDLIDYHGPGTSYSGPTVAPLQDATPVNTGTNGAGPIDVFSVFDSLAVAGNGLGEAHGQVFGTGLGSPLNASLAPAGAGRTAGSPVVATGFTSGPASSISPAGLMPLPPSAVAITPVATSLVSQHPPGRRRGLWLRSRQVPSPRQYSSELISTSWPFPLGRIRRPASCSRRSSKSWLARRGSAGASALPEKTDDPALEELACDAVLWQGRREAETLGGLGLPRDGVISDVPNDDRCGAAALACGPSLRFARARRPCHESTCPGSPPHPRHGCRTSCLQSVSGVMARAPCRSVVGGRGSGPEAEPRYFPVRLAAAGADREAFF